MSLRSVFTIIYSICAAVIPVLTTSCSAPPPQRVAAFAGVQMGERRFPRHGEGELITVESPLPEGFDRCRVEVTPFEHKVFRIRLEAAEIPGNDDALAVAAEMVEKILDLQLKPAGQNHWQLILPHSKVLLMRDFGAGPRAVALEVIDRELEAVAVKLKASPRFAEAVAVRNCADNIAILSRAVEEFIIDNGSAPQKIDEMFENTAKLPLWNGPYCRYPGKNFMQQLVYQRLDRKKYKIYAVLNGKIIKEDSTL